MLAVGAELIVADGAFAHRPQFVDFGRFTAHNAPAQILDAVDGLPDAELRSFFDQVFGQPDSSQICVRDLSRAKLATSRGRANDLVQSARCDHLLCVLLETNLTELVQALSKHKHLLLRLDLFLADLTHETLGFGNQNPGCKQLCFQAFALLKLGALGKHSVVKPVIRAK